jgi:putative tricarboxylic transport membrane protein
MGRDTAIGIGLLVFCSVLYWQAGLVPVPPFIPIGPSFYPRIMLIFLAGLAVWLIAEDVLKKRPSAREKKKVTGPAPNYRRVLWGFLIFLGYVACLDLIGFVTSTFLFILGLSWAIGPRKVREIPKLVAVAAGTVLVCYLLFEKYLYVFLPRGLLF